MIEDDDDDTTSEASKIRNSNSDDDKSDLAMLNALIQTMDPVRWENDHLTKFHLTESVDQKFLII